MRVQLAVVDRLKLRAYSRCVIMGRNHMNAEQKALILDLVAERRAQTDQSRQLAVAAYGVGHPVVARLVGEIEKLDATRAAVRRAAHAIAA